MAHTARNALALGAVMLLSACVSVPIELQLSPTLGKDSTGVRTIQFTEPDRDKALRVIREFAQARRMQPVPADSRLLGPGWVQEQFVARVTVKGMLYDTEHVIRLVLFYKGGNGTAQLLHAAEVNGEASQLELALLDVLRAQFGGGNVLKIGG